MEKRLFLYYVIYCVEGCLVLLKQAECIGIIWQRIHSIIQFTPWYSEIGAHVRNDLGYLICLMCFF